MDSNITISSLIRLSDSLGQIFGKQLQKVYDVDEITSSYLIQNIDEAFESWQYPFSRKLSFEEFCEYILPYKMEDEKPEIWRHDLKSEFKWIIDSLNTNIFATTAAVNNQLHWFKISVNYDFPVSIGYKMSRKIATGTCASASRMVAYPMRAVGLPVVIDFAPNWGNRSSGHEWNALILNNKPYPFDAVEANIGYYKISFVGIDRMLYKPPKIFRKTFSIQDSCLSELNKNNEIIPFNLASRRTKDVTKDYIPVTNVKITLADVNLPNKFSYLCVFNNKNWCPIYWGKRSGNQFIYKSMGRDIVYLPAIYKDSNLVPLGDPFIVSKRGDIIILTPKMNNTFTIEIDRKYPDDQSNKISIGDEYELLYWKDKKWASLGKIVAKTNVLSFTKAPRNALFWIRDLTNGHQERIFTHSNIKLEWW